MRYAQCGSRLLFRVLDSPLIHDSPLIFAAFGSLIFADLQESDYRLSLSRI